MKINIYQVDAFASRPFAGNPAAVCLLEEPLDEQTMHAIADEKNLPMTAFLERTEDGFSLRWFSSSGEAALCGHATLASAHVLFETGELQEGDDARFHTRAGLLTAQKQNDRILLDFPAFTVEQTSVAQLPEKITAAMKQVPVNAAFSEGWHLLELESEAAVRNARPDFDLLREEHPLIITARGNGNYDFVSRFFAFSHGAGEDPVTGSAHCRLAPYWSQKLGRNEFLAYQASERGGELYVKLENDRVKLGGQAVTVMEGFLNL